MGPLSPCAMAGIYGVVAADNVPLDDVRDDARWGTFYLQHRAQQFCGMASCDGRLHANSHKGLLRSNFTPDAMRQFTGRAMIGSVATTREPISALLQNGTPAVLSCDGNIINATAIRDRLLRVASFDGYHDPDQVPDAALLARLIGTQTNVAKGIETLFNEVQGDFALTMLTPEGVYAARGWGRKPLILGRKTGQHGDSFAVASESNAFYNRGYEIERDVNPGEVVLLDKQGAHTVAQVRIVTPKFGTFEWIYTAHPASVIDGRSVAEARLAMGRLLWQRQPVELDDTMICSGIPNSGRWHGLGFAKASRMPYVEVYVRYDYADRSYTQDTASARQEEADYKLVPIPDIIWGTKIFLVDDSIVRGTQTKRQTAHLREYGAKEIHGRIACPPLMCACRFGKTTRNNSDCIARELTVDQIRKSRGFDTLVYATEEDLATAIGKPLHQLCLDCWAR